MTVADLRQHSGVLDVTTSTYWSEPLAWEVAARAAHPLLAGQVHPYQGYRERSTDPLRRREVPHGAVVVIISFGEPLDVSSGLAAARRYQSFVAGIHDTYAVTEHHGRQHGIQFNLTPLGAYQLLGMPMSELVNQTIDLAEVWGRGFTELTERLAAAPGWAAQFQLLDRVLAHRLEAGPRPDPAVAWAWHQLVRSRGQVPIVGLAEEIGWSRRHFISRFRQQVGLAPKLTGRVLRFQCAVDLLDQSNATISEVAAVTGFADHSHLVREFRSLAGLTPTELLGRRLPGGLGVAG